MILTNIVCLTWDSFNNVSLLARFAPTKVFKLFMFGKLKSIFASRQANVACCILACQVHHVDLAKLANKCDQAPNADVGQTMRASFDRPLYFLNENGKNRFLFLKMMDLLLGICCHGIWSFD